MSRGRWVYWMMVVGVVACWARMLTDASLLFALPVVTTVTVLVVVLRPSDFEEAS